MCLSRVGGIKDGFCHVKVLEGDARTVKNGYIIVTLTNTRTPRRHCADSSQDGAGGHMLKLAGAGRLIRQITELPCAGEKYRGQFLFALRIRPHGRDVGARLHPISVRKGGGSRGCCDNDVCGSNGGFGFSIRGRQPPALQRLGERGSAGRIAADHPDTGQWADAGNRLGLITGLLACAENRQNRSVSACQGVCRDSISRCCAIAI